MILGQSALSLDGKVAPPIDGLGLNIEGGNYELCDRDRKTRRKECRFGDFGRNCPARRGFAFFAGAK